MVKEFYHLTLDGQPYCDCLGTTWGRLLARQAGVFLCEYGNLETARIAHRRLLNHQVQAFIKPGPCPHATPVEPEEPDDEEPS